MDHRKNHKLSVNNHIFKYGPPVEIKTLHKMKEMLYINLLYLIHSRC